MPGKSRVLYVIADRRTTEDEVSHSIHSYSNTRYSYEDAARRDAFPTEDVFKVTVTSARLPK